MILRSLCQIRSYYSKSSISKLRNIGIIAHIDAGKTTTTERMLFYSGKTKRIGNVDQGDTITDFLSQERERGITIQSAVISFNWQKDFKINLIDTPGHADFTFEVIRSLKVLDGCVTILDAVAGVEAQTEKVWKQSVGIPKICFINKMDRTGAGYSRTVKELIVKMNTRVLLINIPIFSYDKETREPIFEGVLDVVNKKVLKWSREDPNKIDVTDVPESSPFFEQLSRGRESLVETLGETDEQLIEYFLEEAEGDYMNISAKLLNESIRKATIENYATPVLCGASFRNIGVQPLLDAVVNYLPSPIEARFPNTNETALVTYDKDAGAIINKNRNLCVALAFKVITDPIRGLMTFIRVYSGTLNSGNTVLNSTTGHKFKIGKLVVMHANVAEEVKSLKAGEIGVLTGSTVLDNVKTGDTIITHNIKKDGLRSFHKQKELKLQINPINIPPPVVSASIEPKTLGNKKSMETVLQTLVREDPSLQVSVDDETGQTLLSGMGQLHLEIARDRLLNDLNAEVDVGKVVVSYKETIGKNSDLHKRETELGYKLELKIDPLYEMPKEVKDDEVWHYLSTDNNYLIMENHETLQDSKEWPFQISRDMVVNALISSSMVALQKGRKFSSLPLHSCAIRIKGNWWLPLEATSPSEFLALSRSLILEAFNDFREEDFFVLEPIMNMSISVPQQDMGNVLQDLTGGRKANVLSIEDEHTLSSGDSPNIVFQKIAEQQYLPPDPTLKNANLSDNTHSVKVIKARVPLKEVVSYMSKLRSLTQGRGNYHMEYHGMERVTADRLAAILEEI
ncbi:LAFE_0B11144g1_1 [Lachancea fermentati]|uniref:Ribosome-releasing factor 2, mitochondrial n=1 Tax=Lachancea fermentati TaxID=4955 RepID=A0A1G4M8J7_LACFM|nr:LAFE_0B11144g1_1 [Lachancea fermentati]